MPILQWQTMPLAKVSSSTIGHASWFVHVYIKDCKVETWKSTAEKLKLQNGTRCVYCGADAEISIDHMIPRIKGGTDISDNLVCACKTCNSSKGKKDLMEWYNDKQSFPPLMLLRRYIKLIYNYCYTDCLFDLKLDDPKLNSLPFSIKSLPINYPTPDKLQH